MLRFRLQELLAERQFRTGDRVTLTALATATGVNRVTLSKMINTRGYSTVTDSLDRLCRFFECRIEQLVEYVSDAEAPKSDKPVARTKAVRTGRRTIAAKK
jgi:DNA-binding Xre family transcriptional regulator